MAQPVFWNEERLTVMKNMVSEGLSSRDIAAKSLEVFNKKLSKCTVDNVIYSKNLKGFNNKRARVEETYAVQQQFLSQKWPITQ